MVDVMRNAFMAWSILRVPVSILVCHCNSPIEHRSRRRAVEIGGGGQGAIDPPPLQYFDR